MTSTLLKLNLKPFDVWHNTVNFDSLRAVKVYAFSCRVKFDVSTTNFNGHTIRFFLSVIDIWCDKK